MLLVGPLSAAAAASRRPAARVAPNILVILVDQMRAPCWLGAGVIDDGFPPNVARLRRGGVSFVRHYTASSDCTPSRAALLTGLHTHQTGCMITGASTLDPGFPTWGTMLGALGYETYWYGKWHLTDGDGSWNAHSGPAALARYGFAGGTFPSPNGAPGQGQVADPAIAEQFARFYRETANAKPWCATVSFVNPHDIAWWYRYTGRYALEIPIASSSAALPPNFETPAQLEARGKPLLQRSLQQMAAESFGAVPFSGPGAAQEWAGLLDLYATLQRTVDAQIGVVLDTLASRPDVAANTVVVFTSDHGEYAGSHGMRGKGASVYEEAIRVPLIVNDPRNAITAVSGQPRAQLTSSVDVAPMLLTIACGSRDWRSDSRCSHLAHRPDLGAILADPAASGRRYAAHATDEVVTEFALARHAAAAPLHVTGVVTAGAKYATYSHWRAATTESLQSGQQVELYDYRTRLGQLETLNVAGRSRLEGGMRTTLEHAISEELEAPLPLRLEPARRRGLANYFESAALEANVARTTRLRRLESVAGKPHVTVA